MEVSDLEVPFVDLLASHSAILGELRDAFERVVATSAFSGGKEVQAFEAMFADFVGTSHAVGVGSGTAALHLALLAAGIGAGDEVIVPPNTFFATAEAVLAAGATPVFADVDPATALIDPAAVADAVTPRTAAIIPVHLYGQPAPMDAMRSIATRYGLFLLEDAAQAVTATWDGRQAGSLGDAGAFSFYPSKNLGALGEAGAVVTDDQDLAQRVARLRAHGETARNVHVRPGFNERLDGLQAAFLAAKLRHLGEAQRLRLEAVERYRQQLAELDHVRLLETAAGCGHSYHLLVARVPRRDKVFGALRADGIEAGIHYPTPIHLQPACHDMGGRPGQFPRAEELAASILSLPLSPGMTENQIDRCVRSLDHALELTA